MAALPSAAQCGVCVITISYALSCCHLSKYLDRPKRLPSLDWLANGSAMSLSAFVKSSTILVHPIRPQEAPQLSLTSSSSLLAAPNGFHCKRGIKNAQQIEIRSIIIIAGALTHTHWRTHSKWIHRIIAFPCNCSILNSTRSCLTHNAHDYRKKLMVLK